MQKQNLNLGWEFRENNQMFAFPGAEGPKNLKIDLPHDFIYTKPRDPKAAGGAPNGYFGEGRGIYEKTLEIPEEWIGKRIILDIDGAYMNAEVTLNGGLLAMQP